MSKFYTLVRTDNKYFYSNGYYELTFCNDILKFLNIQYTPDILIIKDGTTFTLSNVLGKLEKTTQNVYDYYGTKLNGVFYQNTDTELQLDGKKIESDELEDFVEGVLDWDLSQENSWSFDVYTVNV